METHCLRQDQIPGTSRLILDYAYRFGNLARFYKHVPYDPESYLRAAAEISYPDARRSSVADALAAQNPHSSLIAKLRKPGTVAVVTGQQVGYLGGPSYTIYKALTAIRVAQELEAQGISAVPVFWLASEDHDLAEVNHAWLFDSDRKPFRYDAEANANNGSPVGPRRAPALRADELSAQFAQLPYGECVAEMASAAYDGERSYTSSFRKLVSQVLGDREILFLDPMQPDIRNLAAPFLADAVCQFPELLTEVRKRTDQLTDAGYHAQVHLDADSSFFFLLEGGQRVPIKTRNGSFYAGKLVFNAEDLAARASQISPNALLRPALQDYLLPTVCLIGGPAEIAYLAQSGPIYDKLLGRRPVFLPRSGFTLLDHSASRRASKYQLSMRDFFVPEAAFVERLAQCLVPSDLTEKMRDSSSKAAKLWNELYRSLVAFDPTLASASKRSKERVLYQFQKLERKVARETARREERVRNDAAYLRGLIYPEKHLQERLYSILPFLAAHGPELVDTIASHVHVSCPDHKVLVVSH
jgi:bacillithiol biosynthesis cysteine-adding enzyme BshC